MKRHIFFILLSICAVQHSMAQYYSVNFDKKTVAAMAEAFNAEAATEMYYEQQNAKIREHYEAAEVATAGIFASKYLDRKALTDLGLWTSSTENYYYRRIYNMVSSKIMPKIWTVAGMMKKSPQNAMYWGSYLYKVCEETKSLCYQFESIVTDSKLSFKDVAFLEINQDIASIFKLSELGGTDWKSLLDSFSNVNESFSKKDLVSDAENLYNMGVNLASAGSSNGESILGSSKFSSSIQNKIGAVSSYANSIEGIFNAANSNAGGSVLGIIGGQDGLSNLFNLSDYDSSAWLTDYTREGFGQFYTQRWYIYKVDKGYDVLCDYTPPTDDTSIIKGNHWTRFSTTNSGFTPSTTQDEQILSNSEACAGWSRDKVQQLNNSKDGFTYSFDCYRYTYNITNKGKLKKKAYAYSINVKKEWSKTDEVYEEVFDSYSMDLNTFTSALNARLSEYNDNEYGYTYYIGSDDKSYYQTTDAKKIAGCETATISVTCHDGASLGEGTTQYKCSDCGSSVNAHTKQCSMATTVTESSINTSELDDKIKEAENGITSLKLQISALESENAELVKKISSSDVDAAAQYRQQYNTNKEKIASLKSDLTAQQQELEELQAAKVEAEQGESTPTDDYYRIPAIMQTCKSAYDLSWNDAGSWSGNTFTRTASMPNINGTITFSATVSIVRKPKYLLGIKIHRAIVQISWKLTTQYSDTQVVEVLSLDTDKSDEEKAEEVNRKIAEVAQEFPKCEVSVEYAKSVSSQEDDSDDTHHLLWTSDRLEIAREIDSRLTKIYADLVSLEKMMNYKHSIIDVIKSSAPYINDEQSRKFTMLQKCHRRWLRNAASSGHSEVYNGKYDDDEE